MFTPNKMLCIYKFKKNPDYTNLDQISKFLFFHICICKSPISTKNHENRAHIRFLTA